MTRSSLIFLTLRTLESILKAMTVNAKDPIKYLEIRIQMLNEELMKNPTNGNDLILNKSISELSIVLDLLKRNRLLSGTPYNY